MIRFFAALEAGDIDTLREIYAPDAVIWHNNDLIEQPVEENLKVLQGLHRAVSGLNGTLCSVRWRGGRRQGSSAFGQAVRVEAAGRLDHLV